MSSDKIINKVLHRLLEEECNKLKKISENISLLNFRVQNFNSMRSEVKEVVIDEMFTIMEENGWNDWVKELKGELNA